jgi:hypothetical protein
MFRRLITACIMLESASVEFDKPNNVKRGPVLSQCSIKYEIKQIIFYIRELVSLSQM